MNAKHHREEPEPQRAAYSGGTAFQDALAQACDEHLRLTGVGSNRMEQDWFDDFCPVDIIGLARLHAYSRGEPMALPAHPRWVRGSLHVAREA